MFEISGGGYKATFAASNPCLVTSFSFLGRHYLRVQNNLTDDRRGELDPLSAACYPCTPYFGRLPAACEFEGAAWPPLSRTHPDFQTPIHGHGWVSDWTVEERSDASLICAHRHDAARRGEFPFAYSAEQAALVDENGLTLRLSVINEAKGAVPFGLGLHPFFVRHAGMRLNLNAERLWTPPVGAAPGKLTATPADLGGGRAAPPPEALVDHSFTGVKDDVVIDYGDAAVHLSTNSNLLHVFAPRNEAFICLEPITHLPGLLTDVSDTFGGARLAPGERLTLTMKLSVVQG